MHVIGREDGSFVFIFSENEKHIGVAMLNVLSPANADDTHSIALARAEILSAGMPDNVYKIN